MIKQKKYKLLPETIGWLKPQNNQVHKSIKITVHPMGNFFILSSNKYCLPTASIAAISYNWKKYIIW